MAGEEGEEWTGGWGRWQLRLALLLALPVLLTGAYSTNYVFLAAPTKYRCLVPECEGNSSTTWSAGSPWSGWALPEDGAGGGRPACVRYRPRPLGGGTGAGAGEDTGADSCDSPASFDNDSTIPCEDYVYEHYSSIVSEFKLGCQEWKWSMVGTVHNIGMLISLPIMGFVSDRWGRRSALVVSGCGAGVLGVVKSFATTYEWYLVGELLETIMGASVYPAAFVLMIEWLGVEKRILASLILGIPLAAGAASLSLLDYLTGYWRSWARWAYPPSFLLLLYPWLLPESVRWLVTQGRFQEAVAAIRTAARCNRLEVSEDSLENMLKQEKANLETKRLEPEESLMKALIKYGALRVRLCVCFAWWFSAVFVFYGLAVNAHGVGTSPHVQYALLAGAQLPALALNTLLLDRVGRRPLLVAALLLTGLALISLSCLTDSRSSVGTVLYLVGQTGATMTLNALYVYTAELFPTRARHRLLAACSTVGRLGAIISPLTPLLAVHAWWAPTALFGALPLGSALLTYFVPDTLNCALPNSFSELEHVHAHGGGGHAPHPVLTSHSVSTDSGA